MPKIKNIKAREILDSRGNPTIETRVELDNNIKAKASVPSGASTGSYEAVELRDGDKNRYGGLGVLKAVSNVNKILAPKLAGLDINEQEKIDELMIKLDGTKNKKKLGANAILSVSLASARAGAQASGLELYQYLAKIFMYPAPVKEINLPTPCFNIFNGGRHADTNLDFQEFMIIPHPSPLLSKERGEVRCFSDKVRLGAEIFHTLGKILKQAGYDTDVGSEGGYAPDMTSSIQAIELI